MVVSKSAIYKKPEGNAMRYDKNDEIVLTCKDSSNHRPNIWTAYNSSITFRFIYLEENMSFIILGDILPLQMLTLFL